MKGFLTPKAAFTNKILESAIFSADIENIPTEFEKLRAELEELSSADIQKKSPHPVLASNLEAFENSAILAEKILDQKTVTFQI